MAEASILETVLYLLKSPSKKVWMDYDDIQKAHFSVDLRKNRNYNISDIMT